MKKAKKAKLKTPTLFGYPFVAGSKTSYAAAEEIKPSAVNLRERVFHYVENHGPVTDEEIARFTGLNPSTARPRRLELVRAGRVVQVGEGKTAAGRRAALWAVA